MSRTSPSSSIVRQRDTSACRQCAHHLVQMPAIARPWRRWRSRRAIAGPNFSAAVAQGEAEIEPDRVLHDLGRKAMAAVAERSHADMLSDTPPLPTRLPDQAASIDLACP